MLDISLATVFPNLLSNPILLIVIVLSVGTLLMNGAHDAANAIATCVATRSMSPGKALAMASVCNFFGVFLMTFISTAVANTIFTMVNFSGDNRIALLALCASMIAMVIWGGATWYLGLPTSQSHALIASLSGAAIALQNGVSGINWNAWVKVLWGLVVASLLGFFLGWVITKLVGNLCRHVDYRKSEGVFAKLQSFTAGALAFLHGAQDGQKFMSIAVLGIVLALGADQSQAPDFPMWIIILCSTSICLGTAIGGKKIIKSVGTDIVKLEKWQGFSATLAASICVAISNGTGLPISTTQTNTTAIMGIGTAKRFTAVNWNVAKNMVYTWLLTFPGCGLLGFLFAKVFIVIFG